VDLATEGRQSLEDYLDSTFGLSPEEFAGWVRHSARRSVLLERLVLHALRQHPRLQVRLIQVSDEALAQEVEAKLRRGADFAMLARQHSEDARAGQGGLYPPLPEGFGYPVLDYVREVKEGNLAPLRRWESEDGTRFQLIQVLQRMRADPRPYAEAAEFIANELESRPVSRLELDAWMRIMEEKYNVRILGLSSLDG